jgi:hypothetical protein
VPAEPQPKEDQLPFCRSPSLPDQPLQITTPHRLLPEERGEEEEGAVGGEFCQTLASLDVQREFYSALLNEIEQYTDATEVNQRMLHGLASAQQQWVQTEIRKRAQELQEQLEWADKALDPQAIYDTKLEREFRPRPRPPDGCQDGPRSQQWRNQCLLLQPQIQRIATWICLD